MDFFLLNCTHDLESACRTGVRTIFGAYETVDDDQPRVPGNAKYMIRHKQSTMRVKLTVPERALAHVQKMMDQIHLVQHP